MIMLQRNEDVDDISSMEKTSLPSISVATSLPR